MGNQRPCHLMQSRNGFKDWIIHQPPVTPVFPAPASQLLDEQRTIHLGSERQVPLKQAGEEWSQAPLVLPDSAKAEHPCSSGPPGPWMLHPSNARRRVPDAAFPIAPCTGPSTPLVQLRIHHQGCIRQGIDHFVSQKPKHFSQASRKIRHQVWMSPGRNTSHPLRGRLWVPFFNQFLANGLLYSSTTEVDRPLEFGN